MFFTSFHAFQDCKCQRHFLFCRRASDQPPQMVPRSGTAAAPALYFHKWRLNTLAWLYQIAPILRSHVSSQYKSACNSSAIERETSFAVVFLTLLLLAHVGVASYDKYLLRSARTVTGACEMNPALKKSRADSISASPQWQIVDSPT